MLWLPTANELNVNVACPLLSNDAVPRLVLPSLTATVPDGIPDPPDEATAIFKTTACPNTLGFGLAVRVVLVALLLTVC